MIRSTMMALLLMLGATASAQRLYKCESGGRITYTNTACKSGKLTEMRVKNSPNTVLKRKPLPPQQTGSVWRDGRDTARAKADARADAKTEAKPDAHAAAKSSKPVEPVKLAGSGARARHCQRMQLNQKRADDKVNAVMSEQRDAMRAKAREHREMMAIECPA